MKTYNITVNSTTYQVQVEEVGGASAAAPVAAAPVVPKAAPAAAPAPVAAAPAGKNTIKAQVPGKITQVIAKVGQSVKTGDTVIMLEAMKMEIPVVASSDGTVSSVLVSVGQNVESGEALIALD